MVLEEETLSKLRRIFDLNLYEVRIWTALLSRGKSTAGELSAIANVPRSRAYDILESLENKGFVVMKIGKPIQYLALSPNEVIERVIVHKFQGRKFMYYEDYMMRYTVPIRRILKIANKVDFDVIHSNSHLSMGFCALILSRLRKIPLITTFHTLIPQY